MVLEISYLNNGITNVQHDKLRGGQYGWYAKAIWSDFARQKRR